MFHTEIVQKIKTNVQSLISAIRREVDEKCALMRYYTASSGNCKLLSSHILYSIICFPKIVPFMR